MPAMRCLSMVSSPRLSGTEQPVLALPVLRCRSPAPASYCLRCLRQGRGFMPRRAHRTWERPPAAGRLVVQARFRAAGNATRHGYRSGHDGDADHVTCRIRAARGPGACWCHRPGRTRPWTLPARRRGCRCCRPPLPVTTCDRAPCQPVSVAPAPAGHLRPRTRTSAGRGTYEQTASPAAGVPEIRHWARDVPGARRPRGAVGNG